MGHGTERLGTTTAGRRVAARGPTGLSGSPLVACLLILLAALAGCLGDIPPPAGADEAATDRQTETSSSESRFNSWEAQTLHLHLGACVEALVVTDLCAAIGEITPDTPHAAAHVFSAKPHESGEAVFSLERDGEALPVTLRMQVVVGVDCTAPRLASCAETRLLVDVEGPSPLAWEHPESHLAGGENYGIRILHPPTPGGPVGAGGDARATYVLSLSVENAHG